VAPDNYRGSGVRPGARKYTWNRFIVYCGKKIHSARE